MQLEHNLAHLVPEGTPGGLMPVIVVIETVRIIIRPGTLAVRLAANMVAGHLLLALLGGQGPALSGVALRGLIVGLLCLMALECGVACIQAYVFTILRALYLADHSRLTMAGGKKACLIHFYKRLKMAGLGSGHPQMTSEAQQAYDTFWPKVNEEIRTMTIGDLKHQELPLARIKKIMKLDEDVKMISAEAPVLFAKAAEIFIHELTMRAWIHTEDNKRRTLQRNDIAMAITKYDQFDFLIDIVPRDDIKPTPKATDGSSGRMMPDQVGYYLQLAQQHQQSLQSNQPTTQQQQQQQHTQPQVVQPAASAGVQTIAVANSQHSQVAPQVIQLQPQQMTNQAAPPLGNTDCSADYGPQR